MERLEIETARGKVAAYREGEIISAKGLPYAEPPVGHLRFAPPKPKTPWAGVLEAQDFSPIAPQPAPVPPMAIPGDPTVADEAGCLTVNFWAPAGAEGLPVLVFIHGGGFTSGASSSQLYNGAKLAGRGAVVASLNYRLGALGFLACEELRDEETGFCGNWGLLDQAEALRFIRELAPAFGGDPENITIFGESAGSMSVCDLFVLKGASDLFSKAIAESGPPAAITLDQASRVARALCKKLGLEGVDKAALRSIPWEEIVKAQSSLNYLDREVGALEMGLPYQPVVDGESLREDPLESFLKDRAPSKALLIGTNRDEMNFFILGFPALREMDEGRLRAVLERTPIRPALSKYRSPSQVFEFYKARLGLSASSAQLWSAVMTDWVFWMPSYVVARAHAGSAPVYLYRFDWETPFLKGTLGACHALELPYVFGTYDVAVIKPFAGGDQPGAAELSDAMQKAWLSFATTGVPDKDWPRLSPGGREMVVFDASGLKPAEVDPELISAWGIE